MIRISSYLTISYFDLKNFTSNRKGARGGGEGEEKYKGRRRKRERMNRGLGRKGRTSNLSKSSGR